MRQKKGQPQHTSRRFVQVVVFKHLELMSMATASMTGELPSQSNLRRKTSQYENPLARLSLPPLHPDQALGHSPWPQAQSAQAPWPHSACAQAPPWQLACGQGWGNSCVAQGCPGWTQGLPVVDMLVLPTITPAASADNGRVAGPATELTRTDSKDAPVKITYTSAEDLASALFNKQSPGVSDSTLQEHADALQSLQEHSDKVHVALNNHRDHIQDVHATVQQQDAGLLDHKDHILTLRRQHKHMMTTMESHSSELLKLGKMMSEQDKALKNLVRRENTTQPHSGELLKLSKMISQHDKTLKDLGNSSSRELGNIKQGLMQHTTYLNEHHELLTKLRNDHKAVAASQKTASAEVLSLSKSLKCSEPLLKDLRREQQITQLQNSMAETQKQILALQASRPASVTGKATTVDVTSIAPRKR